MRITEGTGYELYAKGADRVAKQCESVVTYAQLLAKETRDNKPLKQRTKTLKELKKWLSSIDMEVKMLEADINDLEGYKE